MTLGPTRSRNMSPLPLCLFQVIQQRRTLWLKKVPPPYAPLIRLHGRNGLAETCSSTSFMSCKCCSQESSVLLCQLMENTLKGNDIVVSRNPAAALLLPHKNHALGPCYASSSPPGENAIGYQRIRVAETAAKRRARCLLGVMRLFQF